jgi:hypothetical protein
VKTTQADHPILNPKAVRLDSNEWAGAGAARPSVEKWTQSVAIMARQRMQYRATFSILRGIY